MGLLQFVKDAGEKLFNRGEAKAAEPAPMQAASTPGPVLKPDFGRSLEVLVGDMGFAVENLDIRFAEGRATVSGMADSQETREKVALVVGNVQGVGEVDDRMTVEKPEPEATFYTVVRGDTLSKIARDQYGKASKYPVIFEANRPMLSDPDKIYPGQVLRIPPLSE